MNPNQAPTVQTIDQILATQAPAYQGSIDVINKKQAALPGQFDAQRQALNAQKVQGFNDINNQATGRGLSFSGIPLDEQANYLSTKYLPGLQQLQQQQNEQDLALQQSLADINQQRTLGAISTQSNQQKSLEDYLSQQRQFQQQQQLAAQQAANDRATAAYQASLQQDTTPTAAQYLANWASNISSDNPNYKKNYSWENSGIGAQLLANYGLTPQQSYALRKQILGY